MEPTVRATFRSANECVVFSGISVARILSAGLFSHEVGGAQGISRDRQAVVCHDRWADLASSIAVMPTPIEAYLVADNGAAAGPGKTGRMVFLAVGRRKAEKQAAAECARSYQELWTLLATTLDFVELAPLEDPEELRTVVANLARRHVVEIRRRLEPIPVGRSESGGAPDVLGFLARTRPAGRTKGTPSIEHLFPWVPTDDPWRRLLECIDAQPRPCSLVVHVRGFRNAPQACLLAAVDTLAEAQRLAEGKFTAEEEGIGAVLQNALKALRDESLLRIAILKGSTLAARVFCTGDAEISESLLSTAVHSFDDASAHQGQTHAESLFRGGALMIPQARQAPLSDLETVGIEHHFSPKEATAIWRTPMPSDADLPGIPVNRARTIALIGRSGDDCSLGVNVHRDRRLPVSLDGPSRFRHTYIIGQTGTGKSTLLLRMILGDVRAGRGVCVLDPHGSLIEEVLLRFPRERAGDVVILDVSDTERPVGFNPLRISERDPRKYRLARDLLIDELLCYLSHTYHAETMGPIFESHFRGMLGLLLGVRPPAPPFFPNLMVFRALYQSDELRQRLLKSIAGQDFVLEAFVQEVVATSGGDLKIKDMAQYVTSKLNRFVTDEAIRNIICQRRILDLGRIVNEGKVLLVYLGKGRIGDIAAGLIASQVVARIRREVMRRGSKRPRPFYLYADEFQLFADERFGELLAEARKFGLSLTLAHQFAKQLPDRVFEAVLGNVGTFVSFRIGSADGERLEPLFEPRLGRADLASLPNFRAYVRSEGVLGTEPFSLETSQPPDPPDEALPGEIREASRLKYGMDFGMVEREVREDYEAYVGKHETS